MVGSKELRKHNDERNYAVDFWRFIFSMVVVMAHTNGLNPLDQNHYPFVGGPPAVEFFFILSGFFMLKSIQSLRIKPAKELYGRAAIKYIIRKMAPIFPYYIFSLAVFLLIYNVLNQFSSYLVLKNITYSFFEVFMLQMSGISQVIYNAPSWYLSTLVLTMPLLYYIGLKNKDLLVNLIAPTIIILVYGYYSQTFGQLDIWYSNIFFVKAGLLRAMAGLCVGIICFELYCNISDIKFTKLLRGLLTAIEVVGYCLVLVIMFYKGHSRIDFILVFVIAALFIITYSGQSYTYLILNNKLSYWLGKFSVPLYLTHWTVRFAVPRIFAQGSYWGWLPIYLIASLIYAGIVFTIVQCLTRVIRKSKFKIKEVTNI